MKKISNLVILVILFFQASCSYKPLYSKKSFNPYKLDVIIKPKEKYFMSFDPGNKPVEVRVQND